MPNESLDNQINVIADWFDDQEKVKEGLYDILDQVKSYSRSDEKYALKNSADRNASAYSKISEDIDIVYSKLENFVNIHRLNGIKHNEKREKITDLVLQDALEKNPDNNYFSHLIEGISEKSNDRMLPSLDDEYEKIISKEGLIEKLNTDTVEALQSMKKDLENSLKDIKASDQAKNGLLASFQNDIDKFKEKGLALQDEENKSLLPNQKAEPIDIQKPNFKVFKHIISNLKKSIENLETENSLVDQKKLFNARKISQRKIKAIEARSKEIAFSKSGNRIIGNLNATKQAVFNEYKEEKRGKLMPKLTLSKEQISKKKTRQESTQENQKSDIKKKYKELFDSIDKYETPEEIKALEKLNVIKHKKGPKTSRLNRLAHNELYDIARITGFDTIMVPNDYKKPERKPLSEVEKKAQKIEAKISEEISIVYDELRSAIKKEGFSKKGFEKEREKIVNLALQDALEKNPDNNYVYHLLKEIDDQSKGAMLPSLKEKREKESSKDAVLDSLQMDSVNTLKGMQDTVISALDKVDMSEEEKKKFKSELDNNIQQVESTGMKLKNEEAKYNPPNSLIEYIPSAIEFFAEFAQYKIFGNDNKKPDLKTFNQVTSNLHKAIDNIETENSRAIQNTKQEIANFEKEQRYNRFGFMGKIAKKLFDRDFESAGITEEQYIEAKENLKKYEANYKAEKKQLFEAQKESFPAINKIKARAEEIVISKSDNKIVTSIKHTQQAIFDEYYKQKRTELAGNISGLKNTEKTVNTETHSQSMRKSLSQQGEKRHSTPPPHAPNHAKSKLEVKAR